MADTQNLIARLRHKRFSLDEVAEIAAQAADEIERLQRELDTANQVKHNLCMLLDMALEDAKKWRAHESGRT